MAGAAPGDLFGLPEAPVFYPTADEFADPYAYIDKIRPVGERAGICKVVPPTSWRPPFAIDPKVMIAHRHRRTRPRTHVHVKQTHTHRHTPTDTRALTNRHTDTYSPMHRHTRLTLCGRQHFHFHTRLQRLSALDANAKVQIAYLDGLQSFWTNQGQPLSRLPQLDRRPVNLYLLKREVDVRGGVAVVTERKLWAEVGRALGFSRDTCTSLSHSLKTFYTRYVQPYDVYLARNPPRGSASPASKGVPAATTTSATITSSKPAAAGAGGRYGRGRSAAAATMAATAAAAPTSTPAVPAVETEAPPAPSAAESVAEPAAIGAPTTAPAPEQVGP
jgi:hypothetical protein